MFSSTRRAMRCSDLRFFAANRKGIQNAMDGRGFGFSRSFVKRGLGRLRLLGARQKPQAPHPSPLRGTAPSPPITKNLEAPIYGRQIRVGIGGSHRLSARPTGSSQCVQAPPTRLSLPRVGNADQQSVQNCADSQTSRPSIYGPRQSSRGYAAASGCRHGLPAAQRGQGSLRYLSYACAAWPRRQQAAPGTARPLPFLTRSCGSLLR